MPALTKRTFEQDGFTVIVEHLSDDDMQCETPEEALAHYNGCPQSEKAKYFKQDKRRYNAWLRDKWQYIGIEVSIRKQTPSNWADGGLEVGRSSVWGVESDSGDHIAELEKEEIANAFAEVKLLMAALAKSSVTVDQR